ATTEMRHALDGLELLGVGHNVSFLSALMVHPRFIAGNLTTNFIAEEYPEGFNGGALNGDTFMRVLAVAAALHCLTVERERKISGQVPGYRPKPLDQLVVRVDRTNYPVSVQLVPSGFDVQVEGKAHAVISHWQVGDTLFDGVVDGHRMVLQVAPKGAGYRLVHGGATLDLQVLTPRAAQFAELMPIKVPPDMSKFLLSPMPGLLVSLAVEPGDKVYEGQELAVVEAMKMQNILRAEREGEVKACHAEPGTSLAVDQKILEFE
ncbi:MAG: acetyl/propionyl-CoA carboxylase subunit alpha, partial [Rhodospirillaceae bacterium]|nr:acetyl/propionyl-CoA carboxylase subunit alpha [Rhodospirillaceae bacterium]